MQIGIFGGSFDPPHVGHYLAAVDAAERIGLDRLLWVPAAQQPLKVGAPHAATAEQRFRMVVAATAAYPSFEASRIETDRPGLSYTVGTAEALAEAYPEAERYLLIGEDAWSRFDEWREPARIRSLLHIHVLARRNDSAFPGRVVEVSSTEIRERARRGLPIRGFVQDAVADLIDSEGLYRW